MFDLEEAESSAGWIKELNGEHTPETEEYGISSFVFRDKRPFHPERFWTYLSEKFSPNIIRSKGLFWLSSRPDEALSWGQAGGSLKADSAGVWWASMPFGERMQNPSFINNQEVLESRWDKEFGDRLNELVIIGQDLDEEQIRAELLSCLCSNEEIEKMQQGILESDRWPI